MDSKPFRGTITVEHVGKPYRMRVDLVGLSDNAKLVLGRHTPELLSSDFYDRPAQERIVSLLPQTMLTRNYAPNQRTSLYGVILVPETSHRDRVYEISAYGSPRNEETWTAWLNGASQAVVEAMYRRRKRIDEVITDVDARLDAWLRRIAAKDPGEVMDFTGETWRLKPSLRPAFAAAENEGLLQRLKDRGLARGMNVQTYLRNFPSTARLAAKADAQMATRAALTP